MSEARLTRLVVNNYKKYIPLVLIAGLLYIAHYWNLSEYGLYEDDLTIIPNAIQMSLNELFQYIFEYIVNLAGQGRPLHHSFIHFFSNIGYRINGLSSIYWIGYFIELFNAVLLYALIRRVHPSGRLAFLAGVFYVLYPADTTKVYLTHSLGLHPSILFILLGFHLYLSKHRVLSYILATLAALCYESVFPVFIAAPFLSFEWNKKLIRRVIVHTLILAGVLIVVYLLRIWTGEGRASSLPISELLTIPVIHMLQGPPVALGSFVNRPLQVVASIGAWISICIVALAGVISFIYLKVSESGGFKNEISVPVLSRGVRSQVKDWAGSHRRELELLASGMVMLVTGYAITFTTRAYAITGRDTRVHAAAVLGASIVVAVVAHMSIRIDRKAYRRLAIFTLMLILSFLTAFGILVQQEYVQAWKLQEEFWAELLPLIQDVEPGSVVLIDPQGMEDTRQIWANHWNLPRVLVQFYTFPETWRPVPRVYRLTPGWEIVIAGEGSLFQINALSVVAPPSTYQEVESFQVVLIRNAAGRLVRQTEPLTILGLTYPLKPVTQPTLPDLEEDFLYDLLFNE